MNQITYNHRHVFIIDDSKMDVLVLKAIILSLNFAKQISTFDNPVTAFNFLREFNSNFPDLIFIDLNMPEVNGFQFIERFEGEFSKSTKFIITSSSDDPSDIKRSSKYDNVINYFVKPVNKIDLLHLE